MRILLCTCIVFSTIAITVVIRVVLHNTNLHYCSESPPKEQSPFMQRKATLQSTNLHSCSERQSYKTPILNNAVKDIPPSQQPHYCNDGQPSITTLHLYQQRFSSTFPSSPITNSFVNSPFRLSGNESRPSTLHRADFYNQEDKTGVQGSVLLGYKTKSSFEALMIYC